MAREQTTEQKALQARIEASTKNRNVIFQAVLRKGFSRSEAVRVTDFLIRSGKVDVEDPDIVVINAEVDTIKTEQGKKNVFQSLAGKEAEFIKESAKTAVQQGRAVKTPGGFTVRRELVGRSRPKVKVSREIVREPSGPDIFGSLQDVFDLRKRRKALQEGATARR